MLNAWDIAALFLLILACWLGWKLKSLPLLGLGFALAVAPLAARKWQAPLAEVLVKNLGGKGLQGQQDLLAYWLVFCAAAALVFFLFGSLSKMLTAMRLEGLDRAFGAFMLGVILLAILSLNLKAWSTHLDPGARAKLLGSASWRLLQPEAAPGWAEKVEQSLPDLSKIAPGTSGHSRKKAARP